MITEDQIDKIQRLKARRYSQSKVAKDLGISRSTVARYWQGEKKALSSKLTSKELGLDDLFYVSKCKGCGLVYPMPKFLPSWNCPRCKAPNHWKQCWYKENVSIP